MGLSRKPSLEGEYAKKLREATLEKTIVTSCGVCDVRYRASARKGMRWFRKHQHTATHKQNIEKRRNGNVPR